MKKDLSAEELLLINAELANRLEEAEQLIDAIKAGEVDAFALKKDNQSQIFTLEGGDFGYRMLVENFNEGALTLSDDGLIVYTNAYFSQLLGISYHQTIGKSIFNFIHPESKNVFSELFKKGLPGRAKGEINLWTGKKMIPVYVSLSSLYPTLPIVGMIVTDLTEKKKQEEILLQSEERYHSMISEVQDYAIILLSKEGIIQNWNKGAETIKGYKAEEIIGKPFSIFYTQKDRESRVPEKLLDQAKRTGKATDENYRVRKDGSVFWGSIVITALHDNSNNIMGYVKVTRDLTEKKISEEEIKAKAEELEIKNTELQKMNKELESFAYISSHDLQEPLRKIQTFATRIAEIENQNLSQSGKDMFHRMQQAAKRMQTLIDDLLAYSRTQSTERKFERTDLGKIVQEVKEDLKEEIKEKEATIESGKMCYANIIPFQFRQMLHNLIGNALKFSKPEIPPRIKINGAILQSFPALGGKETCHISIEDNGIGFENQYHEKIFEVFQRLHGRSEYGGTGIGLAIVKKIVENHKGIITAHSQPNGGSTFDIYIPVD